MLNHAREPKNVQSAQLRTEKQTLPWEDFAR